MKLAIAILTLSLFAACAGKQPPIVAHDNAPQSEAETDGDTVQPLDATVEH